MTRLRPAPYLAGVLLASLFSAGCGEKPQKFTTTVEIVGVQRLGGNQDPKAPPPMMDIELKYSDCPGDARRVMRGDKTFSQCGAKFKKGDKVPAEIVLSYSSERTQYRSELVRLDDCEVKLDPKEDANYETVQDCKDLMASGAVVGVHCDRTRNAALVAKCPWLKRR
ncbi:MAG: hypothetical protein ABW133_24675 [Polyangiaceae bacterium]